MDKTYDPSSIESKWYQQWEQNGYFQPSGDGKPYCIMIPPPNVTGTLHMGHAFQDTIMDALIRYHRMQGHNTLWQPGTDHAGIATQMVVDRKLAAEGIDKSSLSREQFIDEIWKWKEQSGGSITQQLRRMGASADWSRERFTMDDGLSDAVQNVFEQLYDEGLIYRGTRLVNWDPVLNTAVSDLEVINQEENGHMWHLRYPVADDNGNASNETLTVATTRPETMLGDTGVAIHPEDPRYTHLHGKQVLLPLCDRLIPIVLDEHADPEKGTGCVKITPAHDFNDYEVGQRHDLEKISILTKSAHINDNAPSAYQGLERFEARRKIVADLEQLGLLAEVKDHVLQQPRGDRSGSVIEPMLTDQWFVAIESLAKPAIEAVEQGRIKFVPDNYKNMYYSWMNDIQDWCISRQIWWGHRIPAWYDNEGNVYVAATAEQAREKYKLAAHLELKQDDDVLDTWFSSALWPFSTLGWPEKTDALNTWYPGNVLVTGFDIIFFWVARMIMFGLKFMDGEVPFKEVYVHGLVRDAEGNKMSKSKGNVLDPIDIIDGIELDQLLEKRTSNMMQAHIAEKIKQQTIKQFPDGIPAFGTDAMRFAFAALSTTGRDILLDMSRLEGYRNFCNKIWNATRYVMMQCEDQDVGLGNDEIELSLADQWIISALQRTEAEVNEHVRNYRFDMCASAIYEFVWGQYCDWYLELSKPLLFSDHASDAQKRGTRQTLVNVLETTLRMMHPIMPYITEEIWQQIKPMSGQTGQSIMLQAFPTPDEAKINPEAEASIAFIKELISGVRKVRSELDIKPSKTLNVHIQGASDAQKNSINNNLAMISTLAKIEALDYLAADQGLDNAATAVAEGCTLFVPLEGLIDIEEEVTRLSKQIEKVQKNFDGLQGRLNNPSFADKAPEAVVNQVRQQAQQVEEELNTLKAQLAQIQSM